jgi:hypothetical protein
MTIEEAVVEVATQLQQGKISERRAAVHKAAELLARRDCSLPSRAKIIALLQAAVRDEAYTSVRDAAQVVLDNLEAGMAPTLLPDDRRHMVGVPCRNGHVTYFDKRELCTEQSGFVRTVVREQGEAFDEIYLPCRQCDDMVKTRIDCEAYR